MHEFWELTEFSTKGSSYSLPLENPFAAFMSELVNTHTRSLARMHAHSVSCQCRGRSMSRRAPRLNLTTATLSTASIQHLKNRKLDLCFAQLKEMGFGGQTSAARWMGGDFEATVGVLMNGNPSWIGAIFLHELPFILWGLPFILGSL